MEREDTKKAFLKMQTRDDVANLLGINERSLRYFLFKVRPEKMYNTFTVPKRKGGVRTIHAPNIKLRNIQRKLAHTLTCVYDPKICAYGFIEGRNNIDNSIKHTKMSVVLNIDLKDFFEQIHFGRVRGMFLKPPYKLGEEAATTIAQIACLNGKLPQGAPSSPILSNMICIPLDNSLMSLAKSCGCTYTRYADDISISTHKKAFPLEIAFEDEDGIHIGKKLARILAKHSFTVNPEKITLRTRCQHQEVTGLTVNEFPNLKRSYTKNLRSILHHCAIDGIYETAKTYIEKGFCDNSAILAVKDDPKKEEMINNWFLSVLKGKILYIRQVKGEGNMTYLSFAEQLNVIFGEEILDVSQMDSLNTLIEANIFILENDDIDSYAQGSGFYLDGVGIITSYHVVENNGFFAVRKWKDEITSRIATIGISLNAVSFDKTIDYAVFNAPLEIDTRYVLKLGDSRNLKVGDSVTVIGYPNHVDGSSPYRQMCTITSEKPFLGAPFFTVSGRIIHGASGGVVLNTKNEAIGIIKGGVATLAEGDTNQDQGFIPIHLAIEHMNNQKQN